MKRLYQFIFLIASISIFTLGLAGSLKAATNCSSINATWNKDWYADPSGQKILTPPFQCVDYNGSSNYDKNSPTLIKADSTIIECPTGQRCVRTQDCSSIGGICFSGSRSKADLVVPDGQPKPSDYTVNVPFRCPGDSTISCYVKKEPAPGALSPILTPDSESDSASTTSDTVTPDDPQPLRLSLTKCCTEIVPKDGNAYASGDYGLNHFVQIGINVYECILCMVAALILLMFVLGAFYFMTSAGDSGRVGTGKKIITGAVIGGIIVFASILIVNFTVKALGGSFTNPATLNINPGK